MKASSSTPDPGATGDSVVESQALSAQRETAQATEDGGKSTRRSRRRPLMLAGQAVVISALVAGTVGFVAMNKQVTVTVDGQSETVRTFGGEVEDVLAAQDITLDARDAVAPGRDSTVERDMQIVVNTAKSMEMTVDGVTTDEWTTAQTVGDALSDLGVDTEGAEVSTDLEAQLASDTVTDGVEKVEVVSPKSVYVNVDGESTRVKDVAVSSVEEVLAAAEVPVDTDDVLNVPLASPVTAGMTVEVTTVEDSTVTEEESIAHDSTEKETDDLYVGESEVDTEGEDGTKEITYEIRTVGGEEVSREKVSEQVVTEPVDEVVLVGTKERPAPEPEPVVEDSGSDSGSTESTGSSDEGDSGSSGTSDGADEHGYDMNMTTEEIKAMLGGPGSKWYQIAECESTFNPRAVNQQNFAHFGLFQFKLATWRGVGGTGNPIDASPREQFERAKELQSRYGWSQWACA
ncbi:G5 domain-containing protein [Brevibacterium litoralis]|uniref:G5 domain-containing protein n=1 Tax=Brevibacterium litoralis TaxID=3138935 RepID=UPI0032EE66A1